MSIGLSSGHKWMKIISERKDFILDQCAAYGISIFLRERNITGTQSQCFAKCRKHLFCMQSLFDIVKTIISERSHRHLFMLAL